MFKMFTTIAAVAVLGVTVSACGSDNDTKSDSAMKTDTSMSEKKAAATDAMANTKDIVDTAVANGSFSTLAAALTAAGLVDTLKGEGPYTVFAPTDAAFKALPAGTVDTLLKPENKAKLTDILTYHVVKGSAMAADLKDGQELPTVEGGKLLVKIAADGTVTVNGAKVTTADIKTSNGVIHVVDTVLLPPASK